jgi:hypothetical protein
LSLSSFFQRRLPPKTAHEDLAHLCSLRVLDGHTRVLNETRLLYSA